MFNLPRLKKKQTQQLSAGVALDLSDDVMGKFENVSLSVVSFSFSLFQPFSLFIYVAPFIFISNFSFRRQLCILVAVIINFCIFLPSFILSVTETVSL